MDVLSSLCQDAVSVMPVQNRSVRPNLQGTLLAGSKRGSQLTRWPTAKLFELSSIQPAFGM